MYGSTCICCLGISFYRIDIRALDKAYSIAFPKTTAGYIA